jgi:hypothetical protein
VLTKQFLDGGSRICHRSMAAGTYHAARKYWRHVILVPEPSADRRRDLDARMTDRCAPLTR